MATSYYVALLRGINVGGKNKIPMPALRELCAGLGWGAVQTYIQSGNVVFQAAEPVAKLEAALEGAISAHFGLSIPVIARATADWAGYLPGNPFPEASRTAPNLVMLALAKAPPRPDAVERLRERAAGNERIDRVGEAIWIHFGAGAGASKLSPGLLDRLVGSPVTTRNWRTVVQLAELAGVGGGAA